MGNMRFKVGDRVRIKNLDWYNENKDDNREIKFENGIFTTLKSTFLGQIMTIEEITLEKQYILMEDKYKTLWTDEMIEGLVEEETLIERVDDKGLPFNEWLSHKGAFHIPDGYELKDENGNVINATKIVLEKKKEYPKTYKECLTMTSYDKEERLLYLLDKFKQLLICRDAYWKIAGEELGLSKSWEPDYKKESQKKYCIYNNKGDITKSVLYSANAILSFPTEEMRDAFKENFDPDIEICKEFL